MQYDACQTSSGREGLKYLSGASRAHLSPDIGDVVSCPELRDATGKHHGEQVQEEWPAISHLQECIFTDLLEPVKENENVPEQTF